MIKKFIISNPIHKKIVPLLDWIMLLRIEKMLGVWALICVGMYIGSILNNSTIINGTDYSLDTFIFFFACSLICGGIFIIQEINEFKIRNRKNNLFNHIDIVDIEKAKIVSDTVVVIGTLLVLYINFFSILLSIIYLLNRFFIKDGLFLSISPKSTSLLFNLFFGYALMKMGFIYVFINSMSDIIFSMTWFIYVAPFLLGLCSVCIFINELEFDSDKSQNMYILASFFCLLSVSIGLKLNEPLSSVSGVTALPFYFFSVLRGDWKDIVRSIRYPILILNFYILTIYPLLFFPLVFIYYLSKYYNWHRLGYHYPTFIIDNQLISDYSTIGGFRIEKND